MKANFLFLVLCVQSLDQLAQTALGKGKSRITGRFALAVSNKQKKINFHKSAQTKTKSYLFVPAPPQSTT